MTDTAQQNEDGYDYDSALAISFGEGVEDALNACLNAINEGWVVRLTLQDGTSFDAEVVSIDTNTYVVWGFLFDPQEGEPISTHPIAEHINNIRRIHIY